MPEAANTIAFNSKQGVRVFAPNTGNRILGNSIFSNGLLGIDLLGEDSEEGVTLNDPKDPDAGANNLQNKPVITSATATGSKTTIGGRFNSTPNKTFTIQFSSNPSGNQGKRFLGQRAVTTDADGNVTFKFGLAVVVQAGQSITTTATGAGSTSEFSAPRTVVAQ